MFEDGFSLGLLDLGQALLVHPSAFGADPHDGVVEALDRRVVLEPICHAIGKDTVEHWHKVLVSDLAGNLIFKQYPFINVCLQVLDLAAFWVVKEIVGAADV